jgi:hypothetical protein
LPTPPDPAFGDHGADQGEGDGDLEDREHAQSWSDDHRENHEHESGHRILEEIAAAAPEVEDAAPALEPDGTVDPLGPSGRREALGSR